MQVFLADVDVKLSVPMVDEGGNALAVDTVQYRVVDGENNEVVPLTALADFVSEAPTAEITVPSQANNLPDGLASDLRGLELHCSVGGNVVVLRTSYIIEIGNGLIVGVNTFQTLSQAEFGAHGLPDMAGWDAAQRHDRINALVEARRRLTLLNYEPLTGNRYNAQNNLDFVPEGAYPTNFISVRGAFTWGGDLALVSAAQFALLPPLFLTQLRKAQIVEANFILGGDPLEDQRRAGITFNGVGESKQIFRNVKPIEMPVCRRALSYLSGFIFWGRKIIRA